MTEHNSIPKHWQIKKLGEMCRISTGKWDANHSIIDGKFRFYTCAFDFLYCNTNRFNGECLILPGNGANVGEVFYYNGEFDAYQRTYVIDKITIFPKFLYYHLKRNWKKGTDIKQYGSATNYIRIGNFNEYNISIPPLPEQQAIVSKIEELFSELDKGIENLKAAQQQLKVYRQSLLKWAFEGRFGYAQRPPNSVKDGELPEGWKKVQIKDVAETFGGYAFKSSEFLTQGKYQVLRMGNVRPGVIRYSESPVYLDEVDKNILNRALLQINDVSITQTGT